MNIPVPFIKKEKGLGDAVKDLTSAAGVKPCGGCQRRAELLNSAVTFVPANPIAPLPPGALRRFVGKVNTVLLLKTADGYSVRRNGQDFGSASSLEEAERKFKEACL